ncbi:uncharacterized protein LOC125704782 isoform X2 [Brienomyrus brachyistius]|uniref:uncharacterized protein LOC125704782 isoform X2 n=1 Tax=Brienomyrus brachyistius TaxID=42636 RepID=UPI0020B1D423|nr:uncharacterized protein LOC125704782 isoform X2 [Brienomyrus brachyistius]
MRRFLTIQRDEDYAQIQFLTAKCNQLVREKALLEREVLLAVERDRALRTELAAVSLRLCQQEQANVQLCVKHEGLLAQTRQQEKHLLTSRPEESPRDTGLLGQQLEQVCAELEQLQSSDAQLESLVEEIQRESLQRTAQVEELQAELRRFKDCMSEEREALLQQMGQMEAELRVLRKATKTKGLEEDGSEPRAISSRLNTWDADVMTDLQAEVDNWRHLYEDLYGKLTSHSDVWTVDGSQQPP